MIKFVYLSPGNTGILYSMVFLYYYYYYYYQLSYIDPSCSYTHTCSPSTNTQRTQYRNSMDVFHTNFVNKDEQNNNSFLSVLFYAPVISQTGGNILMLLLQLHLVLNRYWPIFCIYIPFAQVKTLLLAKSSIIFHHFLHTSSSPHFFVSGYFNRIHLTSSSPRYR